MNEEQLLDLTQMSWISPALCENWRVLNECIMEGEQIEAATVLNILNGILSAVIKSAYEVEKLHLEQGDAAALGRAMDCLSRLYLVYHRQYIRERDTSQPLPIEQSARDAALYGEFLAYLKEAPQVWRLRKLEAELQQLQSALDGCQEENARLLELHNQPSHTEELEEQLQQAVAKQAELEAQIVQLQQQVEDLTAEQNTCAAEKDELETHIQSLQMELASQQEAQSADASTKINLEAYIQTLQAELEAQQSESQAAAQLAADRIAKLEAELLTAQQALQARPIPLPEPQPEPQPQPTPEPQPEPAPEPVPAEDSPDMDPDTFHPNTVNNGVCCPEPCGCTKIGAPLASIRDQIETLDLTLCDAQEITDRAFQACPNLKRIVFPLSIAVGNETFSNCPKLEEVHLEYTSHIGNGAFRNCASLSKVYFTSRRTQIGENAFEGCPNVAFRCRKNSTAAAYAEAHRFDIF
ncbi:MAG: leucine-rich repeat protein [Oscillospiraceae bacterium]|jgi:hypothetical protein